MLLFNKFKQQMNMLHEAISFNDLFAVLFNLTCHSCSILQAFDFGHLVWKDQNNPVTQVDYLIQAFLVSEVRQQFGEFVKIVGEEDLSFAEIPEFQSIVNGKLECLSKARSEIVHQLHKQFSLQKTYNASDLCLWIDPLDCTAGFTNNRQEEVTILVGVTYKGQPICGMIGHPFKKNGGHCVFEPTIFVGSSELPCQSAFEYNIGLQQWKTLHRPLQSAKTVAVSYRNPCDVQKQIIEDLDLTPVRCGGAGYKCLKVITGQVAAVFLMNLKTSKWDSCAGEAIILGMGGQTTNHELESINYSNTQITVNQKGFFMSTDELTFHNFTNWVNDKLHYPKY